MFAFLVLIKLMILLHQKLTARADTTDSIINLYLEIDMI